MKNLEISAIYTCKKHPPLRDLIEDNPILWEYFFGHIWWQEIIWPWVAVRDDIQNRGIKYEQEMQMQA